MRNGDGNENSKKQLCTCSTLFCLFLCLFFARLKRETSWVHVLWKKCHICSPKILLVVFLFAFFSRCRLFFTLLAASISHFLSHRCDKILLLLFFQRYLFLCYPCQCRHQNIVKTKKKTRLCY